MPLIESGATGIRPVDRQQMPSGPDSVRRQDGGSSGGGFRPQTSVNLRTAIQDMAATLGRIGAEERFGIQKLPQEVGDIVKNILRQSLSVDATLAKGIGSTIESQRFSADQLMLFSRMLIQVGTLVDKGYSMELSDETRALLSNLKSALVSQEGGEALEPVLLSKASFELLDSKNAEQLPRALYEVLSQLAQGAAAAQQVQPTQSDSMQFLNQLVKFFMPRPGVDTLPAEQQAQAQAGQQPQTSTQRLMQSMFKNFARTFTEQGQPASTQPQPQMQGQPTSTQAQAQMQGQPASTQPQPQMQGQPTSTQAQPQMQGQPTSAQAQPQMQGQPTSTQAQAQMQGQPASTQAQPQMQGQPTSTQPQPQMQGQPTVTQVQAQIQGQPTSAQAQAQMQGQPTSAQAQPQMQGQPTSAQAQAQNQGQPASAQPQAQMQGQPTSTQAQPQMQGQPTSAQPQPQIQGQPTSAQPQPQIQGQPTSAQAQPQIQGQPTSTQPQAQMQGQPTSAQSQPQMQGQPTSTQPQPQIQGQPTSAQAQAQMQGQPTVTQPQAQMQGQPTSAQAQAQMQGQPTSTQPQAQMQGQPTSAQAQAQMQGQPTATQPQPQIQGQPTSAQAQAQNQGQPTSTQPQAQMQGQPTSPQAQPQMQGQPASAQAQPQMQGQPTVTQAQPQMQGQPTVTQAQAQNQGQPTSTQPQAQMQGQPTSTQPQAQMQGQPTSAQAQAQMQGQPTSAQAQAQMQGQPTSTQPQPQMQGQPASAQPQAQMQGQPASAQPQAQMQGQPTLRNVSGDFIARQLEMREQMDVAKTTLLRQPLQNTPQTTDAMKSLAQFLVRNADVSPREAVMLQNFVNNTQQMMPEAEARHLQNLLRLCQQNVPLTVQQAAVQQNLPDLPRLWAFMQLCDMANLTSKMNARSFKRAGRDVADFATAMRQAMSSDNAVVQNQRTFQMMMPLYIGENERSYPTYISVYDEKSRDEETGKDKNETWLRICVLTDHIGAAELIFRIYEKNQLDMRFYFSRRDIAMEFGNIYVRQLRNSLSGSNLNVGEVRVGSVGERMASA